MLRICTTLESVVSEQLAVGFHRVGLSHPIGEVLLPAVAYAIIEMYIFTDFVSFLLVKCKKNDINFELRALFYMHLDVF
jgi:hypothetical protein